ncbi:hypothetical protein ACVILL_001072 [Bradyrhizobium sp. USDA 3364]
MLFLKSAKGLAVLAIVSLSLPYGRFLPRLAAGPKDWRPSCNCHTDYLTLGEIDLTVPKEQPSQETLRQKDHVSRKLRKEMRSHPPTG